MSNKVLVCVTQQKTCERLIKIGADKCNELGGELYVMHVALDGFNFLGNSKEGEALEYLFGISKTYGAELTVFRSNNIVKTICEFVKKNDITDIILGEAKGDSNIIKEIKHKLYLINVYIIPALKNK